MCDWCEKANKDIHNTILGAVAVSGIGIIDFSKLNCVHELPEIGKALLLQPWGLVLKILVISKLSQITPYQY